MLYDVVILTENKYINPEQTDVYVQNVLTEDNLVKDALETEGLRVTIKSWDDSEFDWSSTKYAIFRTTWDYFERYDEFSAWLDKVSAQTTLLNSENIIRWNIDKHYLKDLKANNVPIVPSRFIEVKEETTLEQLVKETGWKNCVLKPCISGAARHTYKLNSDNLAKHEGIFQELIANEAMMLQPFLKTIMTKGEVSLMVMNGHYTHAILKQAKPGDFRVQDDFGGSVHNYQVSEEEITFAEQAVKACIEMPMYARVDVVWDDQDQLMISELELIEPELWFRFNNHAATVLAKGIKKLF